MDHTWKELNKIKCLKMQYRFDIAFFLCFKLFNATLKNILPLERGEYAS